MFIYHDSQDIPFVFEAGQLHGIFGVSGAGKTTWMRKMAGLDAQTRGGRYQNLAAASAVAYLAQTPHLLPHRTIRAQSVWVSDALRTERWAQALDLTDVLDYFPHRLSGGQYQRAALLRVLATERRVLLLDEPLSQVEESLRHHIFQGLMQYLADNPQRLVIFSSHQWADLWLYAHSVSFVDLGQPLPPRPLPSAYSDPPNWRIARLLGYVASVSDGFGGYWLLHPDAVVLGPHPELGLVLSGQARAVSGPGDVVRQWQFHSDTPKLALAWSDQAARRPREPGPLVITIASPPHVTYPMEE